MARPRLAPLLRRHRRAPASRPPGAGSKAVFAPMPKTACLRTPVSPEQALERVLLRSMLPVIALPEPPRVHKLPAERRQGRGFRQSHRPQVRFGNVERGQERGNAARSAIQG